MTNSADRISGAFFFLFGLAMYFAIIPTYVETAEGGNIAPETLPNIVSLVICACGAWLVLKPTAHQTQNSMLFFGTGTYIAVLACAIYAMSWFGFTFIAPVLALIIMMMIGERRAFWLTFGAVGIPSLIWVFVTQILDRSLP